MRGGVAGGACGGEAGGDVIGIGGRVVLFAVAGVAIGRRAGELATDVALRALHGGVLAGERELGGRVVECGAAPRVVLWQS